MKITLCDIFPMQCVMTNKITGKEYFQLNNGVATNNVANNVANGANNVANGANNVANGANGANGANNVANGANRVVINVATNGVVKKQNSGALTTLYIIILIMVLIGFFITLIAIYLAFKCNKMTPLIIIHVLIAFWVPPIYLLYILLAGCNKNYLKNNNRN